MIVPFPSTIFPCTVHCFPLQHVRTLSSRTSCDSRPSSVLTHQHSKLDHPHCRTLGARAYGSVRLRSSCARGVERSSTTLTDEHSAHEPTALCASDRAALEVSSVARPPSLTNTRRTSLRLCALEVSSVARPPSPPNTRLDFARDILTPVPAEGTMFFKHVCSVFLYIDRFDCCNKIKKAPTPRL